MKLLAPIKTSDDELAEGEVRVNFVGWPRDDMPPMEYAVWTCPVGRGPGVAGWLQNWTDYPPPPASAPKREIWSFRRVGEEDSELSFGSEIEALEALCGTELEDVDGQYELRRTGGPRGSRWGAQARDGQRPERQCG